MSLVACGGGGGGGSPSAPFIPIENGSTDVRANITTINLTANAAGDVSRLTTAIGVTLTTGTSSNIRHDIYVDCGNNGCLDNLIDDEYIRPASDATAYTVIGTINDLRIFQSLDYTVPSINITDSDAWGIWLTDSYFIAMTDYDDRGDNNPANDELYFYGFAAGNFPATNPSSGSLTWTGAMVGWHYGNPRASENPYFENRIHGGVTVTLDDFDTPMASVSFYDVVNFDNPAHIVELAPFNDMTVNNGAFGSGSRIGQNHIRGRFYGDAAGDNPHQEVGGFFDRSNIKGVFGAVR